MATDKCQEFRETPTPVAKASVRKPPLDPELLKFARKLRREIPDAEQVMWAILRNRRFCGYKFRRQHPVKPYVLDFYCHQVKLAIELDGGQHTEDAARCYDGRRTTFLEKQGIKVLRFWNHEVLEDIEAVLEATHNSLTAR